MTGKQAMWLKRIKYILSNPTIEKPQSLSLFLTYSVPGAESTSYIVHRTCMFYTIFGWPSFPLFYQQLDCNPTSRWGKRFTCDIAHVIPIRNQINAQPLFRILSSKHKQPYTHNYCQVMSFAECKRSSCCMNRMLSQFEKRQRQLAGAARSTTDNTPGNALCITDYYYWSGMLGIVSCARTDVDSF